MGYSMEADRKDGFLIVRKVLRASVALVLSAVLACSLCPLPAFANGSLSRSETLKVMKKHDANGYFILSTMDERGDDIMEWSGSGSVFGDMDTMVHEECHAYSHDAWDSDSIYTGGRRSVTVPFTDVFRSKKIAKTVPKKLRSDRFWTYVGKPSPFLDSDIRGAYGLLNEFMAYCWGFNTSVKLYGYAKKLGGTEDIWLDYIGSSANIAEAYVEFRYFIEHYLYYAKKHDKAVYRGIVHNEAFVRAVRKVDARFSFLVKKYDKRLSSIAKSLRKKGYEVDSEDDTFWIMEDGAGSGRGLSIEEYNLFAKALNKKKYVKIEKRLGLKHVSKRAPSIDAVGSGSDVAADKSGNSGLIAAGRLISASLP